MLTPADEANHINKWKFDVPFVCGAVNLGEALRRISEGAAMIRTKGEAGTGDVVEAVRHMRTIMGQIRHLQTLDEDELYVAAKELPAPLELVKWVAQNGKLPVVNFSAGGIATPADAALMMQLGAEGVFVGSGIFKSELRRAAPTPSSRRRRTGPRRRRACRSERGPGRRDARHRRGAHARRGQDPASRLVMRGWRDARVAAAAGLDPVPPEPASTCTLWSSASSSACCAAGRLPRLG